MSSSSMRVRTIAKKKELVEFVRDWRTIVAILVIPLLMFPVLFILFPLLLASEAAELDSILVDVVVQSDEIPPELTGLLDNASLSLVHEPLPELEFLSTPTGDEERLRNGSVDAVLRLRMNDTVLEYAVLYLSTSEQSLEARSRTFGSSVHGKKTKPNAELMQLVWMLTKHSIPCDGAERSRKAIRPPPENKPAWRSHCSFRWCWRFGRSLQRFNRPST